MNSRSDRRTWLNIRRKRGVARKAFTLIELLVVVLIILVLAGLLFPALIHAQKMARIRKAKSEAADLAKAWESFWDTYQKWTELGLPEASWFEMEPDKVEILAGLNSSINTNSKKFMNFSDRQLSAGFKDPWKGLYRVKRQGATVQMEQQYRTRAYMANVRRYATQ